MKKKYFGTDGIRGRVGEPPITPEFFVKLGYAAGVVLSRRNKRSQKPSVVIGKDTRISGYMLESALEAGFSSAGVDVFLTGPIPTPAIAYLTRSRKADFGVIISASHNPYDDNGIKFFSTKGLKLSDEIEHEIESLIDQKIEMVMPNKLGKAQRAENYVKQYIEFCENSFLKNAFFIQDRVRNRPKRPLSRYARGSIGRLSEKGRFIRLFRAVFPIGGRGG